MFSLKNGYQINLNSIKLIVNNILIIKLLIQDVRKGEELMNIEKVLINNNIYFKEIEYEDEIKVYKVGKLKPMNVVVLFSSSNTFKMDRDLMFYLSNQKENYSFWLINKKEKGMFYLEFTNKNNWIETSFSRSEKDEIYFGKIVLNSRLKENEILLKLLKY